MENYEDCLTEREKELGCTVTDVWVAHDAVWVENFTPPTITWPIEVEEDYVI